MTTDATEATDTPDLETPPAETNGQPAKVGRKQRLRALEDGDLASGDTADKPAPRQPERQVERSAVLASINRSEELSIKEFLDQIGTDAVFRIAVHRKEPQEVRGPNGKMIRTEGHLKTYEGAVDETMLARHHGGGKYQLKIHRPTKTGSFQFFTSRTVTIAGDPNLDDPCLNITPAPAAPVAPVASSPPENATMVKEVFGLMRDQLERQDARNNRPVEPRGVDPAIQATLEMLRDALKTRDAELAALRQELTVVRNTPPPKDELKEKLLGSLVDGESGRITSIRVTHESEIRQLKEQARDDEKRINDRFDRMIADMKASHERELTMIKMSHETTVTALRTSHETSLKLVESEVKRLERDNAELREDVKELRAKKEKTILEQVKEIEVIKDAFGVDGDAEKSTVDKIIESIPMAVEVGKEMLSKKGPQAQQQPVPQRPGFYRTPAGDQFFLRPDGNLVPVKKKKTAPEPAPTAPGEPALPQIDPGQIAMAIGYLERAYAGNQVPEVVAQSARPMVPAEILSAISEHGVDTFLSKIAKLPGNSPLATQSGKNWVRKLGKALVGDE